MWYPLKEKVGSISTHAPLAGRDDKRRKNIHEILISTHAPLAGRDNKPWVIAWHD